MAQMLEDAALRLNNRDEFITKNTFSPSSFYDKGHGVCPRYWYLAFSGADFEYTHNYQSLLTMTNGSGAGERIASYFKEAGLLVEAEREVVLEDPPIRGFIDLVVNWQGEEMIGEVKTTRTEAFQWRAMNMQPPGYQLVQLLIYMYVENKDKGFFVIEDKNDHSMLILPIKMTDERRELAEYIFDWMRTTRKSFEAGQLPTRPFTRRSKNCKSCPIAKTCWDGYESKNKDANPGVVDLPVLEVPK
jgi:CRISPR/Cas system-associated exonuclease Cas4 (RecB family)